MCERAEHPAVVKGGLLGGRGLRGSADTDGSLPAPLSPVSSTAVLSGIAACAKNLPLQQDANPCLRNLE